MLNTFYVCNDNHIAVFTNDIQSGQFIIQSQFIKYISFHVLFFQNYVFLEVLFIFPVLHLSLHDHGFLHSTVIFEILAELLLCLLFSFLLFFAFFFIKNFFNIDSFKEPFPFEIFNNLKVSDFFP